MGAEQDKGKQIVTGTAMLIDMPGGPFQGSLYTGRGGVTVHTGRLNAMHS
jgi:hypothetical protein